jgi:hypothetical protein
MENSVTTITGQPRTAGKNVTQCKLTADVTTPSVINTTFTTVNGTINANVAPDPTGNSIFFISLWTTRRMRPTLRH